MHINLYMYTYIYMYTYMYIFTCIYTSICIYTYIYIYTHIEYRPSPLYLLGNSRSLFQILGETLPAAAAVGGALIVVASLLAR